MKTNIQKWGNSLGVRIPAHITKKLSLNCGATVELSVENNSIILTPKKYDLDDMLNQVNEENKHHLSWEEDDVQGRENW